ncbi:hypothetical protein H0H92_014001 [Tricholoma furcatifolium]|nr:hypothetical protein H0H92_014001 [Tricholoma furcatifolium]
MKGTWSYGTQVDSAGKTWSVPVERGGKMLGSWSVAFAVDQRQRHGSNLNVYDGGRSVSQSHSHSHTHSPPTAYSRPSFVTNTERPRRSDSSTKLNAVPEDTIVMEFSTPTLESEDDAVEEWELDEALEEQGLFRGPYRRLVLLYTLTPITFVISFCLLAVLPYAVYPMTQAWPYPSVPFLRHPFQELLTSAALFSLSALLQQPLLALFASILPSTPTTIIATAIHTLVSLTLQQSALALLLVAYHASNRPTVHDAAFHRVWWLALGWAATEAVVGICQGYKARALYSDVIVTVRRENDASQETRTPGNLGTSSSAGQSTLELFEQQVEDDVYERSRTRSSQPFSSEEETIGMGERQPLLPKGENGNGINPSSGSAGQAIQTLLDEELDELLAIRERDELEDAYGMPVIRIPVFISCLQRINDLLLSLGITLLLAQAYLRSTFARDPPVQSAPATNWHNQNLALFLTAPAVWAVKYYLALLHTPLILPRMGVPAVVYNASLVSLSAFFAGLALWEGLS